MADVYAKYAMHTEDALKKAFFSYGSYNTDLNNWYPTEAAKHLWDTKRFSKLN